MLLSFHPKKGGNFMFVEDQVKVVWAAETEIGGGQGQKIERDGRKEECPYTEVPCVRTEISGLSPYSVLIVKLGWVVAHLEPHLLREVRALPCLPQVCWESKQKQFLKL